MASDDGGPATDLTDPLLAHPERFSFFQAVRLLEARHPEAVGIGREGPPSEEAIRLGVNTSLGFPATDIAALEEGGSSSAPKFHLTTNFLGLHGSSSPLPPHYGMTVLHDEEQGGVLRSFLDIFHHRILSLFYRSWMRFRHHFQFRREGKDDFSRAMLALVGLGDQGQAEIAGFPAVRYLRFGGMVTQKPHSAEAVRGVVQEYFHNIPVHIQQATGQWLRIDDAQKCKIGQQNCRLGDNMILGEQVYDRQSRFRISLGPIDYDTYLRFLPGGPDYKAAKKLVSLFCVDMLDFDIELILQANDTDRLGIDLSGESRLGWTTGFFDREKAREDVSIVFA